MALFARNEPLKKKRFILIKRYWQLYLLLLLPVIYLLIFHYYPMLGLQLSFKRYSPREGMLGGTWVGLDYFRRFFNSYRSWQIIRNTIVVSLYIVLANIPVPPLIALSINSLRGKLYKKTVQMITYMPHFISIVVIVGLMIQIFNPRIGLFAYIVNFFGGTPENVFGMSSAFPHLYVWSSMWQNAGWASIIYIAALSRVDQEQHEAAIVDGATRFQRVRFIDYPAIIPTIVILFILNLGKLMSLGFERAFLMQTPLNLSTSEIIPTFVYKVGLTGFSDFSYATAIGFINSIVNLLLILFADWLAKRISNSGLF